MKELSPLGCPGWVGGEYCHGTSLPHLIYWLEVLVPPKKKHTWLNRTINVRLSIRFCSTISAKTCRPTWNSSCSWSLQVNGSCLQSLQVNLLHNRPFSGWEPSRPATYQTETAENITSNNNNHVTECIVYMFWAMTILPFFSVLLLFD